MRYLIKFENETIGSVMTNNSLTDEQICEIAGVKLAVTKEDFESENGYALEELEIIEE